MASSFRCQAVPTPPDPSRIVVDPERDRRFMAAALSLGWRNQGRAVPNPSVGAIIVREGEMPVVVGRGLTAPGGRPHGEALALLDAGEAARGATAYVTLEPCAHHGRAGPCCEALVQAGVARVVTAMEDPDHRVAGKGHAHLRAHGIAVTVGVMEAEARRAHAGHIARILHRRPHLVLKLAVSADGAIGRTGDGQVSISGPESLAYAHAMRAESDAILIGIGTALADDPRLTCRLPGMESRSPIRVVVDPDARLPLSSQIARTAQTFPVICFVAPDAPDDRVRALRDAFVDVRVANRRGGRIDFDDLLVQLGTIGIGRLMVEGGARIARGLVERDLVDEFHLVTSPVIIARAGLPPLPASTLAKRPGISR
ncbi:bifunctional diaminohydroxyphosphoribosylaminopyrimidine deaminase/5-amino-6-(5-phosphoribosylamino)uracil reductase RibD [Methylobrevis pamukkalensis]|uniref:Riboflavin biosynthesis protein RibD n=1 Tax=Methylobrevis pamukkalensis TaxID=1439726 RepID=A0A1E3GXQ6_9HYPH|nr:bifunctional diaminohydroxyphosphoribosylaminopyrimidine deaminase/5-amino-6-(5-phosphoribosylamino)uracil reductase RibD [Methylobrevis pamukkalensis]ODN68813.1 Riboflavin biosynthesis protein RibD [Methylobrevis pamukkalensis]